MKFDVVVVGGGHAGIEAANSAAKHNISVLLITSHLDLIGQMSCNPAIGGIAKGNLVREMDALGGLMGKIIDRAGIHFKMLNQTKGMAVWGNRAQADKAEYRRLSLKSLQEIPNLFLLQGMVEQIRTEGDKVSGVILNSGEEIQTTAVVLCMGTFLNGTAHIGLHSFSCGRTGEPSSLHLTGNLEALGVKSGRLKTGTSPRIDGRTVNFEKMIRQSGDNEPWPFSYSTEFIPQNKVDCWITKTSPATHEIIRNNLDKSPLYSGKIKSIGPRYCPSVEDKVVRFGDRDGHTLFLEPEGLNTHEMYLNGLSTSLPFDVQLEMVHSVSGLEAARVVRPGYAIEYDYFQPLQLKPTLESKIIKNLFFAGQINGTSGYEEAGCQGLIAGINAAQSIGEQNYLILGRETSYIGVLIDDLVTRGTEEPYRMFTSRAEHRLILRQDTCDERLMGLAHVRGLVSDEVYNGQVEKWEAKKKYKEQIHDKKISPENWNVLDCVQQIRQTTRLEELLKRPEVSIELIEQFLDEKISDREIKAGVQADIKYSGFIEKERQEIDKFRAMEKTGIPEHIDYEEVEGLLLQTRIKLNSIKPRSLGQASRIPGVTPADISVLMVYLSKNNLVSRGTVEK